MKTTAKEIKDADRTAAKWNESKMERIHRRADALTYIPEMRALSASSLAWLLETGRASSNAIDRLLALTPIAFAKLAHEIASSAVNMRDAADMWTGAPRTDWSVAFA